MTLNKNQFNIKKNESFDKILKPILIILVIYK